MDYLVVASARKLWKQDVQDTALSLCERASFQGTPILRAILAVWVSWKYHASDEASLTKVLKAFYEPPELRKYVQEYELAFLASVDWVVCPLGAFDPDKLAAHTERLRAVEPMPIVHMFGDDDEKVFPWARFDPSANWSATSHPDTPRGWLYHEDEADLRRTCATIADRFGVSHETLYDAYRLKHAYFHDVNDDKLDKDSYAHAWRMYGISLGTFTELRDSIELWHHARLARLAACLEL